MGHPQNENIVSVGYIWEPTEARLTLFAAHGKVTMPLQKVIEDVETLDDALNIGSYWVETLNIDDTNPETEEDEDET